MYSGHQNDGGEAHTGERCRPGAVWTKPFRVAAVLFDFDGTLTKPGYIDFAAIHQAVGCPSEKGLLEFLSEVKDIEERRRKQAILEQAEAEAAVRCRPNPGAEMLVAFLRERQVPMAIITRNRREPVERALSNFNGVYLSDFALVVARDMPLSPKPLPDGVLHVARELGVDVGELLVIGDHSFDIEAGKRAGALTMLLCNDLERPTFDMDADFVVRTLEEARQLICQGLPLPLGKLPIDLLAESLAGISVADPSVLVGARIGEDAAALDIGEAEVLVLASDPITLASDSLARYAVLANANDVAASGATPRWLLSTLLFPVGTSASEAVGVVREIQAMCAANGVSLCGGHTEITDAVSRPLVVGTMAGTVLGTQLLEKRRMRQGDRVLLTKGVAIEGTGLIAREYGSTLAEKGMTAVEIQECGDFLDRIGILEEARIAGTFPGVTALHDVTEGGLATAVRELGTAGGRRVRVHMERIPIYPQTERICAVLGLNPLGLIGSGSLLITCAPAQASEVIEAISAAGIEITEIGELLDVGEGVEATRYESIDEWPYFERDEVSRLSMP